MKLKALVKGARMISIFPRKRSEIKPVQFLAQQSDEAAMRSDFMKVGKDMQKALDQYGR
tara:strand:- start:976 stop:1152 length:177 start_codon:yes stop_codon:yes gene_type:complete